MYTIGSKGLNRTEKNKVDIRKIENKIHIFKILTGGAINEKD